jgi:DNA polymerase I
VTDQVGSLPFAEIWLCDTEFIEPPGERPRVVCLVAQELRSGREIRLWHDQFTDAPPFRVDDDALFVAYSADAELKCFTQLGWPMPARILDLHAEFRARTSGMENQSHRLIDALIFYGLPHLTSEQKTAGRALVMQGSWTPAERRAVLDYCATDVVVMGPLLEHMLPRIRANRLGLGQALLRGRYMCAVTAMELEGVPIDVPTLTAIRAYREDIKLDLIREVDQAFGVYEGTTFKLDRFEALLDRHQIAWPRTEKTGRLSLKEKVFKAGCDAHPWLNPLRELHDFVEKLDLEKLPVGRDGRNRPALMPFAAKTGRNAPRGFIYAPAKWIRHLIKPEPGMGVAYIDWSLQEWAIAAALSGDTEMLAVLDSGDMYLARQDGGMGAA